jgi:protein-tyrosine phosphatase
MRQVVGHSLWLGHAGDLRDPQTVLAAGIEVVVELADNEPLATLPRNLVRLRFPLSDGGANPHWLLRLAGNTVAALVQAGVPTLICCSCGMNRSVCVAAAGLALAYARSFEEMLVVVAKSGPADVSPGLVAQFRAAMGC